MRQDGGRLAENFGIMKRSGNLFDTAVSFPHLLASYFKARSGTRKTARLCAFSFLMETELIQLQEELRSGSYQPRPYRYFEVRDPKRRTIAVADFRDRVVHHAVVGVLEPVFERCFIYDSYATRKGKGSHLAVFQAQRYLRQNGWFLKADIEQYFDSIVHDILLDQVARKIKDRRLLDLIARILANGGTTGRGLPIGNLTSQFFANVYLNGFDHWVKEELRLRHYIRYMDDFVFFQMEKAPLKFLRAAAEDWLGKHLNLRLKPTATFINNASNGLHFLGTRVFPALIRLHPDNARRASRKLAMKTQLWENGDLPFEEYEQSLNSYDAHFSVYGTHALRKRIFSTPERTSGVQ
ncbi:MAG: hypothetical protein DYG98_15060 [Haliscomenobacteraceae bacterium CHB4]|nr:hypothetical protein [Haliscomenobacteraceae bacterium CHB4]